MFNSKPKTSFTKRLAGLTLALLSVVSAPLFASFGVLEESDIDYYGNATIPPFRDAVEGTESLNARERAFLNSLDQARIINRWYVRFLIGNARLQLKEIETTYALTPFSPQGFTPVTNTDTDLLTGLLAWGKLWDSWAVEAEILISRRLQENFNPIAPGVPIALYLDINTYALFFNVQYILPHVVSFYPTRLQIHFDAGFGPVYKTTDLETSFANNSPGGANSRSVDFFRWQFRLWWSLPSDTSHFSRCGLSLFLDGSNRFWQYARSSCAGKSVKKFRFVFWRHLPVLSKDKTNGKTFHFISSGSPWTALLLDGMPMVTR